jgi:fructokinase
MMLCCGDALFDIFAEDTGSASHVRLDARVGGSPLNVAIGLARLGQKSAYLAKISRDMLGGRIIAHLTQEGVDTSLSVRADNPTTLAIVALDSDGVASYAFYTEGTADRSLRRSELPKELPEPVRVVHVASYSTALEPTASSLQTLVERQSKRRFISYDPNVRPSIVPDRAVWRERVRSLLPHAHLVKVSEEDIAFLEPGTAPLAVAVDWVRKGPSLVVLTRGDSGGVGITARGLRHSVPAHKVNIVDTVGAGDTFQAALLTWLAENRRLERDSAAAMGENELHSLLTFAARAAAVTCGRRGADMARRHEVEG